MPVNNKIRNKIYYAVTAIVSVCVLVIFVIKPGINDNIPSMFGDTIYGKAHKPYVYRTLLPTTVRALSALVPDNVRSAISDKIENNISIKKLFIKLKWEKELAVEYGFAMLLMFLSLWGFSIAVRYLFKLFFDTSAWFSDSVSIIALAGLPPMFMYTSFVYDFPVLFLYTLGLIFLYKQNWKLFLILFFIACWNKETIILLTFIFYIYYKTRLDSSLFNKLLAVQLVIFFIVKILLSLNYSNNPGGFVEFHLFDHNLRLLTGYDITLVSSLLVIILLVFYKWNEKPEFLMKSLAAFIPLFILTLFLGYIDELRDYYEVYPVAILLIAHSIMKVLDIKVVRFKTFDEQADNQ